MRSRNGHMARQKRATGLKMASAGKSKTYASLKNRLDRVFSRWTRLRFRNQAGGIPCCSCGNVLPLESMQAGHFQKRHYLATRWHPENVAPQCVSCNVFRGGNYAAYAAWGVNRYGPDWPARMVSLSKETVKYSRSDLAAMIQDYETKLKLLPAFGAD